MPSKKLFSEYKEREKFLKNLELMAKHQLYNAITSKRINIHLLTSRIKSYDSFSKKDTSIKETSAASSILGSRMAT